MVCKTGELYAVLTVICEILEKWQQGFYALKLSF